MLVRVLYVNKALKEPVCIDLNKRHLVRATAAGAALAMTGNPMTVLAATSGSEDIQQKVEKAAQPIKDLLLGVSDPVCYLVAVWGLLECMLGKGSSGITRIKYALFAYLAMNWLPVLMDIVRQAKP